MMKINFLFVATLWLGLLQTNSLSTASAADTPDRPNVVMILADDLGFGDVGFNGSGEVLTPHLDALASQGLQFTRMRANCTVCSPTRAALLSGVYPDRAGVPGVIRTHANHSWGYFDPQRPTIADRLKDAGYHTAIVGKWHLGLTSPNLPNERGFDHFHGFLGDMMEDYETHVREGNNYMRLNADEIDPVGHATELFTDWSIEYLEQRSRETDQPFFLYVPFNAPHFPIQPPDAFLKRVRDRRPDLSEGRVKNVAFVEHLDDCIGRLLQAIDRMGFRDNTIVAMTSDNGGSLPHFQNNDPWRGGKQSHFDGGLRVPCVVRYPGQIDAGSVSDEPAMTFDLGATFLDYAGVQPANDQDAMSLRGVLAGGAMPANRTQYFVRREGGGLYSGQAYHAIISGQWKLMRNDPFSPLELYDLESDPKETTNVADQHKPIVNRLKAVLAEQIQRGGQTAWQPPQKW